VPKKTKRQKAIAAMSSALVDQRITAQRKADQFTTHLRNDVFWGVCLQLGEIYTDLGEPFVTVNPTTQKPEWNVPLAPERQTKKKQRVQSTLVAMDHSAFIQGRQIAEAAAQRIVASWAKAGIPSNDVLEILNKIAPGKKRLIAQLALEHGRIVSTIESQREACYQMVRVVVPQAGLIVLPCDLRRQIARGAISAVNTCTTALSKLEKAGKIIEKAKQEFVYVRNPMRGDAEAGLMRLREKYLNERKATCARATVTLLKAFDPETPWNANSIRAGRAYRKP
jgi:DNA-binding transcriptional regulator YhcF (GntR family)